MDGIVFLVLTIISILTTYCLYKIYEKRGLYFSLVIMSLITYIFSFKILTIFTISINLGITTMVGCFTIIYVLINKYGIKEAKTIISLTLYTNIISGILLLLTNYYIPAVTEVITISIEGVFLYNYKLLIAYPIVMLLTEWLIIKLFDFVKTLSNDIYINTILIYIIIGLLPTLIVYLVGYINVMSIKNSIFLGVTTFLIGLLITGINCLEIKLITTRKEVDKWEISLF